MLAILFSWIVISFATLSFGAMLVSLYNKLAKQDEQYNVIDSFILGLCFITIFLQIWSLWLPANHIFLGMCLLVSALYWMVNRVALLSLLANIKNIIKRTSISQKCVCIIFFLIIFCSAAWVQGNWDSTFYHYQHIRWVEEYALVPGLANIDDRYGFNSNFILLSAIFTFRFVLGEALYQIDAIVIIFLAGWIFHQFFIFRSDWKRIALLICFIFFVLLNLTSVFDTSTDLLPNLIVFHLFAKLILDNKALINNKLIYITIPVFAMTCKLSVFPIGLFSLYVIIQLFREKNHKSVSFLLLLTVAIFVPWLIRNVIVSGYLIYPLYQIDLFSFDWKVPCEIAILQTDYIYDVAHMGNLAIWTPEKSIYTVALWIRMLVMSTVLLFVGSIIFNTYLLAKRKKYDWFAISYFMIFISLLIFFLSGPSIRFVSGMMCSSILLALVHVSPKQILNRSFKYVGNSILYIFIIFILSWATMRIKDKYFIILWAKHPEQVAPFDSFVWKPYSNKELIKAKDISVRDFFTPHSLNENITIYYSYYPIYDEFPAMIVSDIGGGQFLDYRCLEARGNSLQDGFRTKKDCRK